MYTPPTTFVTINQYYGPWGTSGTYPSYTKQEAQCSYSKTTTTSITQLDLSLDATGTKTTGTGSKYVAGTNFIEQTTISGHQPFAPLPATVPVTINVRSSVGPMMEGVLLTQGCGPSPPVASVSSNQKCFGPTQGENAKIGVIFR